MSNLLSKFETDCAEADIAPHLVLRAAGIHTSLWWRWKEGKTSPTLKNFEKACAQLRQMQHTERAA